jgi:hypothetical protein
MTISIQTLHDVLIAIVTTVGIAVACSIAFAAAGALAGRDKARVARAARAGGGLTQDQTQDDETRELVLR